MSTENHLPKVASPSASDWAVLRESKLADYDGHTGFSKMTPTERLRWLEQAAEFVWRQNAARRKASAESSSSEDLRAT